MACTRAAAWISYLFTRGCGREEKTQNEGLERVQSHHAHGNVRVFDHLAELLEADLTVEIFIGLHHGLVDNL